ncbi:MAG: glycoside hydrolase family 95 protein, partial [Planctomycetota bacterium]
MFITKPIHLYLLILTPCLGTGCIAQQTPSQADVWEQYQLWYLQPADEWVQALPVGNGRFGAMVFGGVLSERIQLNDDTVWAGPPVPENTKGAADYIAKARQLIFDGKYIEAQDLIQKKVMAERISPRSYQTLGDLRLHFLDSDPTTPQVNYRRQLDLDTAIASTTFQFNDVHYVREVFASAVDDVIAVRLTADKPKAISLRALLDRPADFTTTMSGTDTLDMSGQSQHDGKHLGVKWHCQVKALTDGGQVRTENNAIVIEKADAVVFLVASSTDYNRQQPSSPLTHDRDAKCNDVIDAAASKSFKKLRQDHIADHQQYFRRCRLDLGGWDKALVPTDQRLTDLKSGGVDPALVSLYFQYGRYLLIGSSRPGNMPANLQGIWNERIAAPWNSDYHININ